MNKIEKYYLIIIVAINLLIYFFLLPYTQGTVNGHMDAGPAFSLILYVLSISILIVSVRRYLQNKNLKIITISFLLIINLVYWGIRLTSLECSGCAAN